MKDCIVLKFVIQFLGSVPYLLYNMAGAKLFLEPKKVKAYTIRGLKSRRTLPMFCYRKCHTSLMCAEGMHYAMTAGHLLKTTTVPFVATHLEIFHCTHHPVITESHLYFTFCSILNALSKRTSK